MESGCRFRWSANAASAAVASGVRAGVVMLLVVACATPPPVRRFAAEPIVGPPAAQPVPVSPARSPEYGPCVRVLSIDGGGIRGIIPTLVLAELERRTAQPTAQAFDLIVGTSTGGILALGLTRPAADGGGKPAHTARDLTQLYEREGTTIFSPRFKTLRGLWGFFRPKYSSRGLEAVLTKYFDDALLSEALTLVEIPAYDIEERKHFFFRSAVHTFRMRDVARAATAAPAYFSPVTLPIEPRFNAKGYVALIDGGVFANNPAPYALASAALVRPGSQDVLMVSLGSGAMPRAMPYEQAWSWGLLGWASPLVSMIFSDHGVEDAFHHVLPPGRYVRFQTGPGGFRRDLDDASPENVQALKQAAEQLIQERAEELTRVASLLRSPRRPDCPPRIGRGA
jgi:predicted acylesterase/phospholipase RssA